MNFSLVLSPDAYAVGLLALPWLVGCVVLAAIAVFLFLIGQRRSGTGPLTLLALLFVLLVLTHGLLAISRVEVVMGFWLCVFAGLLTLLPVMGSHVFHQLLRPRLMAPRLLLLNWGVSCVLATAHVIGPITSGQVSTARGMHGIGSVPLMSAVVVWTVWIVLWTGRDFVLAYKPPLIGKARQHLRYMLILVALFVVAGVVFTLLWLGIVQPAGAYVPAILFLVGGALLLKHFPKPEAALELASENIVDYLRDGVLILDESGLIRFGNPAAEALLGHAEADMLGEPARRWFGTTVDMARLWKLAELVSPNDEHEISMAGAGGELPRTISFTVDMASSPVTAGTAFILVFRDITEKKNLQERILQEGLTDPLTGFPNRTLFVQMLSQALKSEQGGEGRPCTVFFLNLDRFKQINDTLGSDVGDRVLLSVADRLRRCLSPGNVLARLGGDEFGILCTDIAGMESAVERAGKFRDALAPPLSMEGRKLYVTASIGMVPNAGQYKRGEELLQDANIAMANAKQDGGDRHQAFAVEMRESMRRQARIEDELRVATGNGEFRVYYQPLVDVSVARITGFEALLRWQHPQRGLIPPGEFIHIAEETGLIVQIGRWLHREVCRDIAEWDAALPAERPSVSLNLSTEEMRQPGMTEHLTELLREYGVASQRLHLEVTERMLMRWGDDEIFNRIVDLGIPLVIDDFGTGYSSLSRLQYLPVDALKVDRSFVRRIGEDARGTALVDTILAMSENLGHNVISEGVESREQVAALLQMGCRVMQGYFFSPPVSAAQARLLLEDQSWIRQRMNRSTE